MKTKSYSSSADFHNFLLLYHIIFKRQISDLNLFLYEKSVLLSNVFFVLRENRKKNVNLTRSNELNGFFVFRLTQALRKF